MWSSRAGSASGTGIPYQCWPFRLSTHAPGKANDDGQGQDPPCYSPGTPAWPMPDLPVLAIWGLSNKGRSFCHTFSNKQIPKFSERQEASFEFYP